MMGLDSLRRSVSQLPLKWHLQQDNCPREGKNQYVFCFLLACVILGVFRSTSAGFLRTGPGHSHEDVDQCFGQLAKLIQGRTFDTANEIVDLIAKAAKPAAGNNTASASRIRGGGRVHVSKLDEVCCWKDWVAQLGISFRGLRDLAANRFHDGGSLSLFPDNRERP